jgi:hypothetical protein
MFRCNRSKQVHVAADMRAQLNALENRLLAVHAQALTLIELPNWRESGCTDIPHACCKLIVEIKSLDATNVKSNILNGLVSSVVELEKRVGFQPSGIEPVHSISMASRLCGLFACRSSKIQPARPASLSIGHAEL